MLTGSIRNQIDAIWDAFWSSGIPNPLEVLEQITCLLFLRRLDDLQTLEENKSAQRAALAGLGTLFTSPTPRFLRGTANAVHAPCSTRQH